MSQSELKVGGAVPLRLQLFDGDTGKFPQAFIYDESNSLLSTKDLSHLADGEYGNSTYVMPNNPFIHVRYRVWNESGHSTDSTLHSRAIDIFNRKDETIAAISDGVWDEAASGHTTSGTTGEQQNRLDATVSSRESETSASTRASTDQTEHDSTQSAIAALTIPSAASVADAVWDEALSGHTTTGSAGKALGTASSGSDPESIANAVWDENIDDNQSEGSAGKYLKRFSNELEVQDDATSNIIVGEVL